MLPEVEDPPILSGSLSSFLSAMTQEPTPSEDDFLPPIFTD